jgi:hypothetical protein
VAKFVLGEPVVTEEPFVVADGVEPGDHVFTLVVVDDDGNESRPAKAAITVTRRLRLPIRRAGARRTRRPEG